MVTEPTGSCPRFLETTRLATSIVVLMIAVLGCEGFVNAPEEVTASVTEEFDLNAPLTPSVGGSLYLDIDTDLPPILSWSTGGGDGIGIYRVRINGGNWKTITESPPYTVSEITALGEYVVEIQERDSAGNWSDSTGFTFRVVAELPPAPAVSCVEGLASNSFTNRTTLSWAFTDIGSEDVVHNWRYSFDLQNWTEVAPSAPPYFVTFSSLRDGTYTFFVAQEQALGGWTAPGSHTLTVDTVAPPTPTIRLIDAQGEYFVPEGAVLTHADPFPVEFKGVLGGGGNGLISFNYNGGPSTEVAEETETGVTRLVELPATGGISAGERDAAGNLALGDTGVRIGRDSTPPTVSGAALTADQTPTWSWTNTDAGVGDYIVTISNDATGFTPIREELSTTSYTPATALPAAFGNPYAVEVVALDAYGFPSTAGSLAGGTEIVPGGDLTIGIVLEEPRDKTVTLTGDSSVALNGLFSASVSASFSIVSYAWYAGSPVALQSTGSSLDFVPSAIGLVPGTHRLQLFYAVLDGSGNEQLYSAELYFDVTS